MASGSLKNRGQSRGVAQPGSAPALGAGCREFKSHRPDSALQNPKPCTYILYSHQIDRYYIGSSTDMDFRLTKHLAGDSRWTSRANDWTLVFLQSFATLAEAVLLERRIKRAKSRKTICRYIKHLANEVRSSNEPES